MVQAMEAVGVDGAIFISAFSMYRYDASYAIEVQNAHPGRFHRLYHFVPCDVVRPVWYRVPRSVRGIGSIDVDLGINYRH
jgi:hypothetical protein